MSAARMQEAAWHWTDAPHRWLATVAKPQSREKLGFLRPVGWVVALELIVVALFNGLPFALGNNASLALSLAGSSAVHLSSRPSKRDILATAVMAVALRALYSWFIGPIGNYFGSAWISWGSFLGFASLLTLGVRALTARGILRKTASHDFWVASALLYSWIIAIFAMDFTPRTMPFTLDRFLYAFDGSLGFEPSFAAGRMLAGLPLLKSLTFMQYEALMLGLAMVYAWQRMRPIQGSPKVLPVSVSMMIAGYFLYHLYPAAGPAYGFGSLFPQQPPEIFQVVLVPIPLDAAARNAMPSLHMGIALLIWWHSRGSHWVGRLAAGLFLLATAFSTMATGEHYLIDLVVAFPFAMAIQAAWATSIPFRARARYLPMVTGISMTFAWFALLRFGIHFLFLSPVLPWLLVASTVVYSLLTEIQLTAAGHKMYQAAPSARRHDGKFGRLGPPVTQPPDDRDSAARPRRWRPGRRCVSPP
jgi:hypothetical protein